MNYENLILQLEARGLFRIQPELERVRRVLSYLGDPQDKFPIIHIAGTNGKGSVSASFESVLRQAGYRTGLYTSPHLNDVKERIQIANSPIHSGDFQKTAENILEAENKVKCKLTYFEFLTVLAFAVFAEAPIDVGIIEVGMGGRWDATNVVRRPALTVITSIGLDHTQWLGRTETAIAREKAGILKPGVPLVSGAHGAAARTISRLAKAQGVPCWTMGTHFSAEEDVVQWKQGYQRINYKGKNGAVRAVALNLLGRYQIDNAALVLAGLEILQDQGWKLNPQVIERGMARVSWPGRFQIVPRSRGGHVVLDGAHNPAAVRKLLDALEGSPWKSSPKTFIFGCYRDKDYRQMLRLIRPHAQRIILCELPGPRSFSAQRFAALNKSSAARYEVISNPHEALKAALQSASSDELIIVTGSLSLVGLLMNFVVAPARHLQPSERKVLSYV